MPTSTTSNLGFTLQPYTERTLLAFARPTLKFYATGMKTPLPAQSGKQMLYHRLTTMAAATTALTEGTAPSSGTLAFSEVTATVQQYGAFLEYTDMNQLAAPHNIKQAAMEILGENAGTTIDTLTVNELKTGTSVVYATGTARSSQTPASPITLAKVQQAVTVLKSNNAPVFKGNRNDMGQDGLYMGFIHPKQFMDLKRDTPVQNTFIYSDPQGIYQFKVEVVGGVMWCETTLAPVFTGSGASAKDVYGAIIVGRDAFGVIDFAGQGKLTMISKPFGSAGVADPLDQRATEGWKSYQAPKILNNNFMVRVESGYSGDA